MDRLLAGKCQPTTKITIGDMDWTGPTTLVIVRASSEVRHTVEFPPLSRCNNFLARVRLPQRDLERHMAFSLLKRVRTMYLVKDIMLPKLDLVENTQK